MSWEKMPRSIIFSWLPGLAMTKQGFQGLSNFQPGEKERDPLGERKTASDCFSKVLTTLQA